MVGSVQDPTHASVRTHGMETTANIVSYPQKKKISTIYICVGVCETGFCQNGGTCLYPHINCTCPVGWTGDRCSHVMTDIQPTLSNPENNQERTGIIASSMAVASLVALAVAVTLIMCVVDRSRRMKRVRFIQASIRYSGPYIIAVL